MSFFVQMRVGSLEMTGALLMVAAVAARPRPRAVQEFGHLAPVQVMLRIIERGVERAFEGLCPLSIGRDQSSQLILADPEVSRRHARLEAHNGDVYLRDLDSRNGTFLNGKRIRGAIELFEGDEVDAGTTRIIVEGLRPWT
jgi:hypothetical protein